MDARTVPPGEAPARCSFCSLGKVSRGPCRFTIEVHASGDVLRRQGEVARTVLYVRDGHLALSGDGAGGEPREVSLRGPGSLVGAEALHGEPAPYEVRAVTPARVCAMTGEDLGAWVGPSDSPARAVLDLLLAEGRATRDDAQLRLGDCLSRVARFAASHGAFLVDGQGSVRKAMVARLLGMRPETLSRCLTRLADAGLIDASRGLKVLDRERLEALAADVSAGT